MGVLRVFAAFEDTRLGKSICVAIGDPDKLFCFRKRLRGNAQRVGTHISNQTHSTQAVDLDAFVQFLRGFHDAACLEAQSAGGILLHR